MNEVVDWLWSVNHLLRNTELSDSALGWQF